MANNELSYDYSEQRRDLNDEMMVTVAAMPTFLGELATAQAATRKTHEWQDDHIDPETDPVAAGGGVDASATALTVTAGGKFSAGMVLVPGNGGERVLVSAVAGNVLTISRGYGSTVAAAIADATVMRIVGRPLKESTDPGEGDPGREPILYQNYVQKEDHLCRVSRDAQAIAVYGVGDALNYKVEDGMQKLARRLNNASIYGVPVQPSEGVPGAMGGVLHYVNKYGSPVDAAAAALNSTLINDALEAVAAQGGLPNVLVCNTHQARVLSGFLSDKMQIVQGETSRGGAVYQFIGDLPMGMVQRVVVDINWPTNAVGIIDTGKLRLNPWMGGAFDEDATPPGADYVQRRLWSQYTLEVRNPESAHGLITNLAIS